MEIASEIFYRMAAISIPGKIYVEMRMEISCKLHFLTKQSVPHIL